MIFLLLLILFLIITLNHKSESIRIITIINTFFVHDRLRVSRHPQLSILHEHIIIITVAAEGYQVILN